MRAAGWFLIHGLHISEPNAEQSCSTQRRPRIEKHQQRMQRYDRDTGCVFCTSLSHGPVLPPQALQPRAPTFPLTTKVGAARQNPCRNPESWGLTELGACLGFVSALTEGRKLGLLPGSKPLAIQILSDLKRETENVSISVFLPPSNSRPKSASV